MLFERRFPFLDAQVMCVSGGLRCSFVFVLAVPLNSSESKNHNNNLLGELPRVLGGALRSGTARLSESKSKLKSKSNEVSEIQIKVANLENKKLKYFDF